MYRRNKTPTGTVYLIHFETRFKHAGHYLGYCDDLGRRLAQHRGGDGARLMEVIASAGIAWKVVRTWAGDRAFERTLKRRKNTPRRLCPVCMGLVAYDAVDEPGVSPSDVAGVGDRPVSRAAPQAEDDPPF
jgi:predicted GIY-YIG superfamily endonuclease